MNVAWIHGAFSPPSAPGERLSACEGDPGKDELATAQGGGVQGMMMLFTGAPVHFGHGHQVLQDEGMQFWLQRDSGQLCQFSGVQFVLPSFSSFAVSP